MRYQTAPRPDRIAIVTVARVQDVQHPQSGAPGFRCAPATVASEERSLFQNDQQLLQFHPHLADDLVGDAGLHARLLALQACARTGDGEALFVQQRADLPDHQHVVTLVIAAVAAALDGLERRELLLPIAQHVRLHRAQVADLANREVTLGGDGGKFVVTAWVQHSSRLAPSASGRDGKSPPCARRSGSPRRSWDCAPGAGSSAAGRNCRSRTTSPAPPFRAPRVPLRKTRPRIPSPRACSGRHPETDARPFPPWSASSCQLLSFAPNMVSSDASAAATQRSASWSVRVRERSCKIKPIATLF